MQQRQTFLLHGEYDSTEIKVRDFWLLDTLIPRTKERLENLHSLRAQQLVEARRVRVKALRSRSPRILDKIDLSKFPQLTKYLTKPEINHVSKDRSRDSTLH